jgi:hypothetical protein
MVFCVALGVEYTICRTDEIQFFAADFSFEQAEERYCVSTPESLRCAGIVKTIALS